MGRHALWTAMLAAGLLAACGGGGGDTSAPTVANVTLDGTAAKGLMANAQVSAHAIAADGSVADAALASATTDSQGAYTLKFEASSGQPYVIRVTATADTTHVDELTGSTQPLPAGFSMRSLFVPASTGAVSVTASVTPFSEMAVAAAQKASGGLTADNAKQAISSVTQLLGFNPVELSVVPATQEGASTQQQQMAVMLAAVSQLAASDAVGCDAGAAGEKIQCVVQKLADSSSTSSIKLQSGQGEAALDVSAALARAVGQVVTNPTAMGSIPPSIVESAVANLGCEGSACDAAPATPDTSAAAIAAAKALFDQLKTDIGAVFLGSGSAVGSGPVNTEALAFQTALKSVQVPAEMLMADLGALIKGADLYNDFRAGRSGNARGHASGFVASPSPLLDDYRVIGCTVYQDAQLTVPAGAPADGNYVGCRSSYYAEPVQGGGVRDWRHGFTLTPTGAGAFSYSVVAGRRGPAGERENLSAVHEGTLTVEATGEGHITSFAVAGSLPGAFASGGNTLVNDHHTWNLSGTRTISGFKQEVSTLQGTLVAYKDASTVEGTLTINSGKSTEIPMTEDMGKPSESNPAVQGDIAEVELDLTWTTASAEFAGALKATDSQWDASGRSHLPTKLSLSGSLRNVVSGQAAEFAAGTLTTTLTGYESFNAAADHSASNKYGIGASFVGSLTAPDRPKLALTVSGSGNSFDSASTTATMQYRTLVNGSPRTVVAIAHSKSAAGADVLTLSEATSNLSLQWTDGTTTANLKRGDLVIGTLDTDAMNVTFTDGSHASLDLGF